MHWSSNIGYAVVLQCMQYYLVRGMTCKQGQNKAELSQGASTRCNVHVL